MPTNLKSSSFRIGGMTCVNCRNKIERKLKSTVGVEDAAVNFNTGSATVTYNTSVITFNEIAAAIEKLDYQVFDGNARRPRSSGSALETIGILVIILSLYMLLRGLGISTLTSAFPLAEAGMGYGMLLVIGLVTSVHCVAMCGGINLSQCIPSPAAPVAVVDETVAVPAVPGAEKYRQALFPSILYNAGRIASYTTVGIIVGALGSVISLSGRFQGLVQLAAGVFMVIMGINMLGFFPLLRRFNPHMPKIFARKIEALAAGTAGTADPSPPRTEGPRRRKAGNKNPLIIGLLNGLMPCGPLQAMQLYALSTGSPFAGGISMFLFSAGTVPLMFGFGALGSVLSSITKGPGFTRRVMQVGAILITVMGMTMFTYGFSLSGFSFDFADRAVAAISPPVSNAGSPGDNAFVPVIEDGVQRINSTLNAGRYPAITVQQGLPVKWIIDAPRESINGCNNRMIIREYGIEYQFTPGENVIEFTPSRTGRFSYSCWMGMIRSSITVIEEGQTTADIEEPDKTPFPAGVAIATDNAALAEIQEGGYQRVTINLRDDGIDPAIIVVQKQVPASWVINNDSLDPGNRRLIFPAYYTQFDMKQGDNEINFIPAGDFDFSTADNVFYGYVKVVDDLNNVNIEAIKAEISEHEPLIYPEAYFEQAYTGQGSCCTR